MKKKVKIAGAVFLVALVLASFLGFCWYRSNKLRQPIRIIYIPKIIDNENDFWVQLMEGARMAALEYNMELTIVAPETEEDYEGQNEWIRWAIGQKPDAILLSPSSYTESAEAVWEVKEHKIPLVLIDSDVEGNPAESIIGTDNVKAGRVQGEFMRKFLDEDSQIALVCHVKGSSTALEREQGIRQGLGEFEKQIVDMVYCDSDYDKAYELMNQVLDEHPDIDMVAGLNEYSAVGAARAIIDRGLEKQIRLVGFDSSLEEIQLLEEGIFEGIVIQNPYKMGYLGVEAAFKLLAGEKVEKKIDSDCKLITREELYSEENQKVLFMFREE